MPDFKEKKIYDEITELSKQAALTNLLESGVDTNFTQPIIEKLKIGVTTGANISDLLKELSITIVGDEKNLGRLERYTKQVAHDALAQFQRTYIDVISKDVGIEFWLYLGTAISDTRPFCEKYLNQYFHTKEVEMLGNGIDPFTGTALSNDLLKGRINGTNASNIFTNCGGWNCRHIFAPSTTQFTPNEVVKRALVKGYIQLNKRQLDRLGL